MTDIDRWSAEEWRRIPDYSGYEVSNYGRVRSWRHKNGWRKKPLIMKLNNLGKHYGVQFFINGKCYPKLVHRLVLTAFVGPCPVGMECCHNNGDGHDNYISNLRWDTHSNNAKDIILHGRFKKIPNHHRKLSNDDIRNIRKLYKTGLTHRQIAKEYKLSHSSIGRITRWEGWKNVTD